MNIAGKRRRLKVGGKAVETNAGFPKIGAISAPIASYQMRFRRLSLMPVAQIPQNS
jgi:hypothetical protein